MYDNVLKLQQFYKNEYNITDPRFDQLENDPFLIAYGNGHLLLHSLVCADDGFPRSQENRSLALSTLTEEQASKLDQINADTMTVMLAKPPPELQLLPDWESFMKSIREKHDSLYYQLCDSRESRPTLSCKHVQLLVELLELLERLYGVREWWLSAKKTN